MVESLKLRDASTAKRVAKKIYELAPKQETVKICHVCGTHEWTITHFGLRDLLPSNVEVIAGPGCPVCIVPASEIDEAVQLALKGVVVTCFGDLLRVPGSKASLLDAKAEGADVRVVYSASDAIRMARNEADKEFVFFAVGFETTAPSTALEVTNKPPQNFSFLTSHRLVPPAMKLLLETEDLGLDGFIAPGHVSTIIGLRPYEIFPKLYRMPVVVAGFEPLDVLFGVYMVLRQLIHGEPCLENEYVRAVSNDGNKKAQILMNRIFEVTDGNWRGLGSISSSRFALRDDYLDFDAHSKYAVKIEHPVDLQPGCRCNHVIIGKIRPIECPLFMKTCTVQKPVGACMVSSEGTCSIWARNLTT